MTPKPRTNRSPSPTERQQRRRLAEWLAEWRLEQTLLRAESSPGDDAGVNFGDAAAPAKTTDRQPEAGQIRLMMPDIATTRSRPVYVLVLMPLTSDEWLIVPFGILATPAIPGEWRTGLRALPVRVLCVWNARRLTNDRLQRSWHGRDLDSRRLAQARRLTKDVFSWSVKVSRRISAGVDEYSVLPNMLGPPLVHPLDPRRQYLEAESGRLDALGPLPATVAGNRCWQGQPMPGSHSIGICYERVSDPCPLLQAAESRADYAADSETSLDDITETVDEDRL